jgi:lysophospholipase L1-like esterase
MNPPRFDPRSLLFWPGVPLIAAQGLWLRRTAYRAAPAGGEPQGEVGVADAGAAPLRLLCLGDSIIAGVGVGQLVDALPGQFARALAAATQRPVVWRAVGHNGATLADTLARLQADPTLLDCIDLLLLSCGVNDSTGLRRRRAFAADLHALLDLATTRAPQAQVLLAAAPPLDAFPLLPSPLRQLLGLRARQLDTLLRHAAERHVQVRHVPIPFRPSAERFAADGFHPNAAACAEWAGWLAAQACAARR